MIASRFTKRAGLFGFPVMLEGRWCRRAASPPAGARGVLASLLFLLPPQAAIQVKQENRKALLFMGPLSHITVSSVIMHTKVATFPCQKRITD